MTENQKITKLFKKCLKNFNPPEKLTVTQWADKYRYLSSEASAMAGKYRSRQTPYMVEIMDAYSDPNVEKIFVVASSQVGKALDVNTLIPTPNGFTKMGELKNGDIVFDENGKECRVTFATEIMYNHKCYEVEFSDGSKIVADAEHRWFVNSDLPLEYPNGKNRKAVYDGVVTTQQIAETVHYTTGQGKNQRVRNRYAIPMTKELECTEKDLLIKPYTLGVWLGDGHSYSAQFCGHLDDFEIVERVQKDGYIVEVEELENRNYNAKIEIPYNHNLCLYGHDKTVTGITTQNTCKVCQKICAQNYQRKNGIVHKPLIKLERTLPLLFSERLHKLNLINNKHIPEEYLRASIEQRYELLQGLMDTDGYCSKNGRCEITLTSKKLIDGVCELLATLGIKYTIAEKKSICTNAEHDYSVTAYRISFIAYDERKIFNLKRKQERIVSRFDGYRRTTETERRRIVNVKEVETRPVRCIQVDSPNHLYLAGKEMIVTHNTESELNILGYIIDNDPCGVIFAVPTIQDAKDFAKERVMPMIRDNPTIRKKFGSIKSRDASNTIREKTFPGGVLNIVGVNVASQLASKPRRVVIGDEIDRWTGNTGGEGDPWGLLEARTMTFYNRKMIAVSTPTVKGHSRIEEHFLTGTQEYWCYQCPNCGEYHRLRFQDMKFEHHDTKEKGKTTIHVDWVKWKCPDCGEMFTEKEVKSFPTKWIATNPAALKNHIRSFWINGFSSPFPVATWEYLIWRFLEAGKDPEKLQTVFNTLFGELWEDRRDLTTEEELLNRRENYEAELPDGVLMLTCAVDTQDDRLEYEVKGWGKFKESWGIKKGYIMGRADSNYVWERLDDIISHAYSFKDGKTMSITVTLVDSGGHYTQAVYANCYKRSSRYVFPIKGVDRKDLALARPLISPPNKQAFGSSNEYRVWLYSIGVNSGKRAVQDFLKVKEHGSMFCHFPLDKDRGYDAKYFNGLLSEVEIRTGNKVEWQIIPGHKRNEPFDLFVYNYAALMLVDPDFDAIEARLRGVKQERKEKPKRKVRKSSALDMFD